MSKPLPPAVQRQIEEHFKGHEVRFVADRYEAEALVPTHGRTMDIVRLWVASDKDHIAWVVGSKVERIMVLDRLSGQSWNWVVAGDADEQGATLYTFTWIKGHLIMVYAGDHYFYLASLCDGEVALRSIRGDSIRVMEDRISTGAFTSQDVVQLYALPSLNLIEKMTVAEAEERRVRPISLGLEYHKEQNHYPLGHSGQLVG